MKFLQLRQSRRHLMLMWRIRNKKTNNSPSGGLTRTSVVVVVVAAGGAILMAVEDVVAEAAGTRMVVGVADTRMAVAEAVGTTMNLDTTSRGTTTTEAGVVARAVATLITTTMVEVHREAAMGILGGLSWAQTPSSLTILF
jgi:hypothetical protein